MNITYKKTIMDELDEAIRKARGSMTPDQTYEQLSKTVEELQYCVPMGKHKEFANCIKDINDIVNKYGDIRRLALSVTDMMAMLKEIKR